MKGGWKPSSVTIDGADLKSGNDDGLKGRFYERTRKGVTEYVYAYAGTEDLLKDGVTDVAQLAGASKQYDQAYRIANDVSNALGNAELTFVGHSLGGGLANLSALATDRASVTFNPAWISMATLKKYNLQNKSDKNLTNYVILGEILDATQRAYYISTLATPVALIIVPKGETHYLFSSKTAFTGILSHWVQGYFSVKTHLIDEVINQIEDVDQYNRIWKDGKFVVDK